MDSLDQIREQTKELDFCQGVIANMLKPGEIVRVKEKTEFDFDSNKWLVPAFYLRNKEVVLPKLGGADMVQQELQSRNLFMGTDDTNPGDYYAPTPQGENRSVFKTPDT